MVTVTYTASEHMAYMLSEHQAGNDVVLRMKLTNGGIEMQPDKMRPRHSITMERSLWSWINTHRNGLATRRSI
jgi:hypothetical protein